MEDSIVRERDYINNESRRLPNYGAVVPDFPGPSDTSGLLENMGEDTMLGVSTDTLVSETSNANSAKKLPQYIAALSVTLGAFGLGNVLAWTSPTASELSPNNQTGAPPGTYISESDWSWVGSLLNIGAAVVVLPVGYMIDKIGRKFTMLSLVLPFTAGWFLMAWADPDKIAMYFVGRILTGAMGGAFSLTAPVYTSEISQNEIRGTLGSYFQLMVTIGILFVYALGSGVDAQPLTIVCGVVPLVFGAIFFFMPETPILHLQKGRPDEARKSLQFFRGKNYNVDQELQEMEQVIENNRANRLPITQAFSTTAAKKALFISLGLMAFQQLSGVNAVIFYSSNIFQAAGSSLDPKYSAIIIGAIQVVATFVSTLVVDRLGRRILLLISDSIMALCTLVLGVYFYLQSEGQQEGIEWLPIVSLSLFLVVFSLGYGPIPWLMVAELFPAQIKGTASSISCMFNWFLSFLVTKFYADLVNATAQHTTFWIFAGISAIGTVFVFFIVPETKGKSLEQIQEELGGSSEVSSKKKSKDIEKF